MLESALAAPLQPFDFVDFYPTITDKLTRLSFGLIMNHPFLDGNKRIGAYALTVGLKLNWILFSLCCFTAMSFCLNVNFIWKAPPMALERCRWMDSMESIHHCYCSLAQWEGCTTECIFYRGLFCLKLIFKGIHPISRFWGIFQRKSLINKHLCQ